MSSASFHSSTRPGPKATCTRSSVLQYNLPKSPVFQLRLPVPQEIPSHPNALRALIPNSVPPVCLIGLRAFATPIRATSTHRHPPSPHPQSAQIIVGVRNPFQHGANETNRRCPLSRQQKRSLRIVEADRVTYPSCHIAIPTPTNGRPFPLHPFLRRPNSGKPCAGRAFQSALTQIGREGLW